MKQGRLQAAATAALFVGVLLASFRANGTSPIEWTDTFNDDTVVRRCVVENGCTLTGTGTSVPGFRHAVSWFELRALLAWLGLGADGAHVAIQVFNALGAALVFVAARRLGGRFAGVLALWLFVSGFDSLQIRTAALYNSPPLGFLGAVFALACIAVVGRPGVVSVTLAALVAAIMANVHLACVLAGLSVAWVAFLAPRRRIPLAIFGMFAFALATFLVSPPLWLHNADNLLHPPPTVGNTNPTARLEGFNVIFWSLFAVAAWGLSLRSSSDAWARCRRQMIGTFAVTVPFILAFLIGWLVGMDATGKYFAHIVAAAAIGAALPIARAARQWFRSRFSDAAESWHQAAAWSMGIAPFVIAVTLPATSHPTKEVPATVRELRAVLRILRDQHGWTNQQIVANMKSASGLSTIMGLRELAIADDRPEPSRRDPFTSAMLLFLNRADLPRPLPPNWEVIRPTSPSALVLIVTRSRLDWHDFDVCLDLDGTPQSCQESGLRFDRDAPGLSAPNMPWGGPVWNGRLMLRVPLERAGPDLRDAIFMPRMPLLCGGSIRRAANDGLDLSFDQRAATIVVPDVDLEAVELEWQLDSPACPGSAYDGWPPFVVAGEEETVRLVEAILRKHEAVNGS